MVSSGLIVLFITCLTKSTFAFEFMENVPEKHIPYILHNHPEPVNECLQQQPCHISKKHLTSSKKTCFGYEENCPKENRFSPANCERTNFAEDFWKRADFGYVSTHKMDLRICKESQSLGLPGSLKCSKDLTICHGKNVHMDLRNFAPHSRNDSYKSNMFARGEIGANCDVDEKLLSMNSQLNWQLMSWSSELKNFSSIDVDNDDCDVIINEPIIVMKLDYGGNMYHHFCDFFNLYVSQHVNGTNFSMKSTIYIWNVMPYKYFDGFADSWSAFTSSAIREIHEWAGKRVYVKDIMFSLLPRMRSGLYYNTYIPKGCVGSSLFKSFSEHFLHRMGIEQHRNDSSQAIRITLLQRGSSDKANIYRQIKNQKQLLKKLKQLDDVIVKVVEFTFKDPTFHEQLTISLNSDIFIGMHGAGLAHFMFLPNWAVAVELYNCGDDGCYKDLARLRGVNYMTWENNSLATPHDQGKHERYGHNPKFWNWSFDENEFIKFMKKAISKAKNNLNKHFRDNHDEL